jgi:hypothetical protein
VVVVTLALCTLPSGSVSVAVKERVRCSQLHVIPVVRAALPELVASVASGVADPAAAPPSDTETVDADAPVINSPIHPTSLVDAAMANGPPVTEPAVGGAWTTEHGRLGARWVVVEPAENATAGTDASARTTSSVAPRQRIAKSLAIVDERMLRFT